MLHLPIHLILANVCQIDGLLDDSTTQKIIDKFSGKDVTQEMLEGLVGRTRKAGWTQDDRRNLLGLWNGLENEETTVNEIFDGALPAPEKEKTGPVSGSDLQTAPVAAEELTDDVKHLDNCSS